jgi:hypothetical protein
MGVPSLAFIPLYKEEYDYHPSLEVSLKVFNKEDAFYKIKDILSGHYKISVQKEAKPFFDLFNKNSKEYACEKILFHLEAIGISDQTNSSLSLNRVYIIKLLLTMWKCYHFLKNFKRCLNREQTYMRNPKWPGSTLEEVRQKVRIFGEVDSRLSGIKVEKLFDNLYYLHK